MMKAASEQMNKNQDPIEIEEPSAADDKINAKFKLLQEQKNSKK